METWERDANAIFLLQSYSHEFLTYAPCFEHAALGGWVCDVEVVSVRLALHGGVCHVCGRNEVDFMRTSKPLIVGTKEFHYQLLIDW